MPIWSSVVEKMLSIGEDYRISFADSLPPMTGVDYKPTMPRAKQSPKLFGYGQEPMDRPGWEKPIFDLLEIAKAAQVESYIRLSIDKHREHILRHGWSFVGKNQATVSHVYKRLHEISEGMGMPIEEQITQSITNLVKYHNAFLCKTRDRTKTFKSRFGIERGKVTGLFSLNPVAMRFRRSDRNQILEWHQVVDNKDEQLKPSDVVHIPFSREDGYILGTPYILQVLDDVQFLRRIEEIAGKLLHKFAYPLYHHKIGDKDNPPDGRDDGSSDIGEAFTAISGMAPEGHLVTSYTHSIEVIGANTKAIDLKPYLEYAKNRVTAGLNLSSLDLGEGDTSTRNCYSEDTEVLTNRGWLYYTDVLDSDLVAAFNPATGKMEFQPTLDGMRTFDYDGPMLQFKNRRVDVCVTPDHDMWVGSFGTTTSDDGGYDKYLKWKKCKFKEVTANKFAFMEGAPADEASDLQIPPFELPPSDYVSWVNAPNRSAVKIDMEDWVEFLGWYLSEGALTPQKHAYAVRITQSQKHPNQVRAIRALFNRLPFKHNERLRSDGIFEFEINSKALWHWLEDNCGPHGMPELKHIPRGMMSLPPRYLRILLDALIGGDGTVDKRPGRTNRAYYSSSQELLDNVQEVALKVGLRAKKFRPSPSAYRHNSKPNSAVGRVSISGPNNLGLCARVRQADVSEVPCTGKVWCVVVPNHLFFTRRNGCVTIQGNTAESLSKGLADRCGEYQEVFARLFTFYVLDELLLEGGYELSPENRVYMFFPEIDRESKRAEENHYADLFVKNLITHQEWRSFSGREPFTDEQWKDTQFERITKPELELKAAIKEVAAAENKAVANKSKPANQHGTKSTKTRVTKDMLEVYAKAETANDLLTIIQTSMQSGIDDYNIDNGSSVYLGPGMVSAFTSDCAPALLAQKDVAMLEFHVDTFITAAHNYAYMRAGQIHTKATHAKWALTDDACPICRDMQPVRIRRFMPGNVLPIHDSCVCGIEFFQQDD